MAVEQGQLLPTDTTKDLANFYNDAVVSAITAVDRVIHNGTQFVRLVLQQPQPESAGQASFSTPDVVVEAPHLIDGIFTANPSSSVNLIRVGYALNQFIATTRVRVFSTVALDTTPANWEVATSLVGSNAEFNLVNFKATNLAITETAVTLDGQPQFRYTIDFTPPAIGGLRFWRVRRVSGNDLSNVTEIEILQPRIPTLSFFNTDGTFATSTTFQQRNILDATFDNINDVFYTIRFNTGSVGTGALNLGDDFSDSEAGSAAGTTDFNPSRWVENNQNPQFIRSGGELIYNVSTGKGQIETTYTVSDDIAASLFVNPKVLSSGRSWLVLRALDDNNNTLMSEGVGMRTFPTTTGIVFSSFIDNLTNSTNSCQIRELRPQFHNTIDGVDSFSVTFDGTTWTVSGSLTGALANASTGVVYNEATDPNTPIEFIVSCTAPPTVGEKFTFDLQTVAITKPPLDSITIGINRTGANYTSDNVILSPVTISTAPVSIEIFGNTSTTVNFSADDYTVVGSGSFPELAVFTVEKTDSDGDLISPPLIEAFDVVGDPSKTINDFLDGRVQITTTQSGTGGGFIYIKVNDRLFKYDNNIALGTEDGTNALQSSIGQIAIDNTSSFNWSRRSVVDGLPFLTYVEFDDSLGIVRLRTLDKDTLLNTSDQREVRLNIPTFATNRFKLFFDQNDFDSLQFVDANNNLQSFNVDDRISAFMAVNASDTTLPAGTASTSLVSADVVNAWGEALNGKSVVFSVTAGDGAITPAVVLTSGTGRATTTFTVGTSVGVSQITAQITEN